MHRAKCGVHLNHVRSSNHRRRKDLPVYIADRPRRCVYDAAQRGAGRREAAARDEKRSVLWPAAASTQQPNPCCACGTRISSSRRGAARSSRSGPDMENERGGALSRLRLYSSMRCHR